MSARSRHSSRKLDAMLVHNNRCLLQLLGAALLLALATFSAAAHQAESTQPVAINSALVTATGTVAELTVKNQLTGVTLRYLGLKVDQGTSYTLTGAGLETLSDGSRINVTGTLTGNIFNVTLFRHTRCLPQGLFRAGTW
jgi:opacity protein-like surface antigen